MLQMRPIGLTLIAAAILYQGVEAVLGMLGAFSAGRININLMFILLFAGVGLLRLSNGWRLFTLVYLGLAAALIVGLAGFEMVRPGQLPVTWFGSATSGASRYILFASLWLIAAFLLWWAFKTLTRPEIVALFKQGPNKAPEPTPTIGGFVGHQLDD